MRALAKLLFEAGMLKKMRRTGYPFLGSGGESIADHCFRAALIGYLLALELEEVDEGKVALLLLHHDLAEARTGDLNYMNKRYCTADEDKALEHATRELPEAMGKRIRELCGEFNAGETAEAQLAHDADQLDLLIELKEQQDLGNPYAKHWIHYALKRLQTEAARELAHTVLTTDWTDWWFEKRDDLWVRNNHNGH
ncbi:MAG: HD domain-containing protein [Desulfarculaceae bacterium]|nr:HD domain-containing protein [Desulfarculaceae bacterium]MCF8072162.1 HD domain-containing protein [Desulfarculaceae bacterium]MCF8100083.1 HD domain-containing protein [Desulfarculaceae bacterium]MCF8117942.1 HD domain-containing protein [Desulfarculaceae bacterium]